MRVFRFIFCALPGAFIVLVLVPAFIAGGFEAELSLPRIAHILIGVVLFPIGAALVLYGTGKWGKWWYVLPVVAAIPFLMAWGERVKGFTMFILFFLPFFVAIAVHELYRRA
jgi:hypothetical protein